MKFKLGTNFVYLLFSFLKTFQNTTFGINKPFSFRFKNQLYGKNKSQKNQTPHEPLLEIKIKRYLF